MLIKNALVVSTNPAGNIIKSDIRIADGKIVETGKELKGDDNIIDASGMAALPGFVNTHCHSPMSLLRGYADDLPLDEWLHDHVWPIEAKFRPSDYYDGAMLSCAEMIRSGITSFADMYFNMEEVAKAINDSGIRGVLAPTVIDNIGEHAGFGALKRFLGGEFGQNVVKSVSLHAPYSCSEETLMKGKEIADGLRVQIHVAETFNEVADMKKMRDMTPVEWLDSIGFLGPEVVAAHCVHMSDRDIGIMKSRGVKMSHCPASNMKLASGISPVWRMMNEGICTGLGTDGSCSNNRIDMFQEMKTASLLQKVFTGDPSAFPAGRALEAATIRGAEALGLNCGSIEAGKDADIILVNMKAANLSPFNNIYSHIVYSASPENVDTVICGGKTLMRNRKILAFDEEKIIEKAEEAKERLISE